MEKEKKLGAGIITLSILFLIGSVISVGGTILNLTMGDSINQILIESGQFDASMLPTTTDYIINLVIGILNSIFIILIMLKNKIGVFGYFGLSILSNVYSLITTNITTTILISLVIGIAILALYGFFIYKKRDLYGFLEEKGEAL